MQRGKLSQSKLAIVAIPAHDEVSYIPGCLSALALQRDETGAPVPHGSFEILVFANNCQDDTVAVARRVSQAIPHPIRIVEEEMPREQQNAGGARKRAMDLAAARLADVAPLHGIILTTDADSRVSPTWFAATLREFENGADCVAGYIDAIPDEYVALGGPFLERGRLEDTYLCLLAEISARCDPRPHDPWPNHRVSSGASLAIRLAAYSTIGGLPPRSVGEDSALTETLDRAGFKVRHSMDVCVSTSSRLDGRATGGAADTMRYRHAVPNAVCDENIETALQATRRALYKGLLRRYWMNGPIRCAWPVALGESSEFADFLDGTRAKVFEDGWDAVCDRSLVLKRSRLLRPSDLPREIAIARMIVRQLREPTRKTKTSPGDKSHREEFCEPALSGR